MSQGLIRQAIGHDRYFMDLFGWTEDVAVTELVSVDQLVDGRARFYDTPTQQHEAVETGAVQLHPTIIKILQEAYEPEALEPPQESESPPKRKGISLTPRVR
jgi:hypothetical protein